MRQIFANALAAPFVGGAILFLYLAWSQDSDYAPWMIPFVIVAGLIYTFNPQINWWWYTRHPPQLSPGLIDLLERFHVFYGRLNKAGKQRFCERIALYRMGTDWEPVAWPEEILPPDVETALAAQAVTLTFNEPEFLLEKFEKVIVYPKPFPTPEYPFAHASELYEADGCLLFSAEQVMQGYLAPGKWYNIAMHEYAKAFVLMYPGKSYPDLTADDTWEKLEATSGMSREHVESIIGIAGVDALPVAIHHYFTFPDRFPEIMPEAAELLDGVFAKGKGHRA